MRLNQRIAALRGGDDAGAALLLALIFITVVAVAIATLLAFADTSLRTTVALRTQAAQASNADGAAQVAIDNLRLSTYVGVSDCLGPSNGLQLSNFYQSDSAYVSCSLDDQTSKWTSGSGAVPTQGLLTLGTAKTTGKNPTYVEDGIDVNLNNMGTFWIQGNAASKSTIDVEKKGSVQVKNGNATAASCIGNGSVVVTGGTLLCNNQAAADALIDPNYPTPPAPITGPGGTATNPAPTGCGTSAVVHYSQGIYTSPPALNCANAKVYDFRPGYYYFNFTNTSNEVWDITTTLVAGARNPLTSSTIPDLSKACTNPITTPTDPTQDGVVFVFGNDSQMKIETTAQLAICGKVYNPAYPPVAIYGLKTALGSIPAPPAAGKPTNGCILDPAGCSIVSTNGTTDTSYYVMGAVYAPLAKVTLSMKKDSDQYFEDGMVARALAMSAPGSALTPMPLFGIPVGQPGPSMTVVYLTVYVCPNQSTCSAGTGTLRLRAKVGINDPQGKPVAGQREITVYSWSVQR
jgi:hypothetical protein